MAKVSLLLYPILELAIMELPDRIQILVLICPRASIVPEMLFFKPARIYPCATLPRVYNVALSPPTISSRDHSHCTSA